MTKDKMLDLMLAKLEAEKLRLARDWQTPQGTHTRHLIIDDFLPREMALEIYQSYPRDAQGFFNRDSFRERKKTLTDLSQCPKILSDVTYAFQDPRLVAAVAKIVDCNDLRPDPTLYAAGLSMMFENDFLNPHLDNSHDGDRQMFRRLNLLYYVTPDWEEPFGGNLELWDLDVQKRKTLHAKFNRLVVMDTNRQSWHSVSRVDKKGPRCCVSNYFFSPLSPDAKTSDYFHVTSFIGRPEEKSLRFLGRIDNALRNLASHILKTGRGRELLNSKSPEIEKK